MMLITPPMTPGATNTTDSEGPLIGPLCGFLGDLIPLRRNRIAAPGRAKRAKEILFDQSRALPGYQGQSPWLVPPRPHGDGPDIRMLRERRHHRSLVAPRERHDVRHADAKPGPLEQAEDLRRPAVPGIELVDIENHRVHGAKRTQTIGEDLDFGALDI